MIKFVQKGNFKKAERFFRRIGHGDYLKGVDMYGEMGVKALSEATPKDTGLTADSWDYEIRTTKEKITLNWVNTNVNNGVNIALIIQYGHAMPSGYYIQGIDYINPALKPVFDEIGKNVWKEVTEDA